MRLAQVRKLWPKSRASNEACVELNCAAIPEELLESELFGYEWAFKANRSKIGLIELANDGVIFLDEIAELSINLQEKLLRFIEYIKFKRLGSTKDIYFKGRVIAATNRNLQKMIELNTFREDLFHRLSAINLDIPPLRHRKKDLPIIFEEMNLSHYLQQGHL